MMQLAALLAGPGGKSPSQDIDGMEQDGSQGSSSEEQTGLFSELVTTLEDTADRQSRSDENQVIRPETTLLLENTPPEEAATGQIEISVAIPSVEMAKDARQTTLQEENLFKASIKKPDAPLSSNLLLLADASRFNSGSVEESRPVTINYSSLLQGTSSTVNISEDTPDRVATVNSPAYTIDFGVTTQSKQTSLEGVTQIMTVRDVQTSEKFSIEVPPEEQQNLRINKSELRPGGLTILNDTALPYSEPGKILQPNPLTANTGSDLLMQQISLATPGNSASSQNIAAINTGQIPVLTAQSAVQQVAGALTTMSLGSDRMEIMLDPPELGRVYIDFNFDSGRTINAIISTDQPDTASLMKRHLDTLAQELSKAGFENIQLAFGDTADRQHDQQEHLSTPIVLLPELDEMVSGTTANSALTGYTTNERLDLIL